MPRRRASLERREREKLERSAIRRSKRVRPTRRAVFAEPSDIPNQPQQVQAEAVPQSAQVPDIPDPEPTTSTSKGLNVDDYLQIDGCEFIFD